jgi:hypothetical protein
MFCFTIVQPNAFLIISLSMPTMYLLNIQMCIYHIYAKLCKDSGP